MDSLEEKSIWQGMKQTTSRWPLAMAAAHSGVHGMKAVGQHAASLLFGEAFQV